MGGFFDVEASFSSAPSFLGVYWRTLVIFLDALPQFLTISAAFFVLTIGCVGQVIMARLAAKVFVARSDADEMRSTASTSWKVALIKSVTHGLLLGTFYSVNYVIYDLNCDRSAYWAVAISAVIVVTFTAVAPYFYIPTLFVSSVASIEDRESSIMSILQHAWLLAKGKRVYLTAHGLVLGAIVYGVSQLWMGGYSMGTSWGPFIVSRLPFLFMFPLFSIFTTVLYLTIRIGPNATGGNTLRDEIRQSLVGGSKRSSLDSVQDDEEAGDAAYLSCSVNQTG